MMCFNKKSTRIKIFGIFVYVPRFLLARPQFSNLALADAVLLAILVLYAYCPDAGDYSCAVAIDKSLLMRVCTGEFDRKHLRLIAPLALSSL